MTPVSGIRPQAASVLFCLQVSLKVELLENELLEKELLDEKLEDVIKLLKLDRVELLVELWLPELEKLGKLSVDSVGLLEEKPDDVFDPPLLNEAEKPADLDTPLLNEAEKPEVFDAP